MISLICGILQGFVLSVVHLAQNKKRARLKSQGTLRVEGGDALTGILLMGEIKTTTPIGLWGPGT